MNFRSIVTEDNFKFVLALACKLGEPLFSKIPEIELSLVEKQASAPVYEMALNVFDELWHSPIAHYLARNLTTITVTHHALVMSLMKWGTKLPDNVVPLSFQLLPMIKDEKEDFRNLISGVLLAATINSSVRKLMIDAADRG